MSRLETEMALIIEVFAQNVGAESNSQSLSNGEMRVLLEKELPGFLQSGRDKEAVDKLLKDLDANGDAMVDFNEFIVFVAAITAAGQSYFPQKELNLQTWIPEGGPGSRPLASRKLWAAIISLG